MNWRLSSFSSLLKTPGVFGFIAGRIKQENIRPLGFILCRHACFQGDIIELGVIKKKRRQGTGTLLLKTSLRHAKRMKIKTLFLEVRQNNRIARVFYEKMGFKQIGLRRGYYRANTGKRQDAVLMSKRIS